MTEPSVRRIISADSHVIEPRDLFESRVPTGLKDRMPKLVPWEGGDAWHLEGLDPVPLPITAATGSGYRRSRQSPDGAISFDQVMPGLYDPAARVSDQTEDSIDAEVLYPSPALWDAINQLGDTEFKLACVRAYNDWLGEFCAHDPTRLIGLGKIPATGIADATEELRRCVEELHFRGVILDSWPSGKRVAGDPGDNPFWEAVDGFRVPVSLHYSIGGQQQTLPSAGISPGLKPPMADAVVPLVSAEVFDHYPNLQIVFAHGDAGWASHWLEFMDSNYVRHRHLPQYALPNADALPSEYIRKHSFFTFHHDRSAVRDRHKLGVAHLLWASHFPLDDSNWPENRQQAVRVTEELPVDERAALLSGNTARLYRLPDYEDGFDDAEVGKFAQLVYF